MQNADGHQLGEPQQELVECYDRLARLLGDHGSDLAPFEARGGLKALASLWQVVNGLDMDRGQIYHLGA